MLDSPAEAPDKLVILGPGIGSQKFQAEGRDWRLQFGWESQS